MDATPMKNILAYHVCIVLDENALQILVDFADDSQGASCHDATSLGWLIQDAAVHC